MIFPFSPYGKLNVVGLNLSGGLARQPAVHTGEAARNQVELVLEIEVWNWISSNTTRLRTANICWSGSDPK